MKLRIKENSIRLRLSQSEVASLANGHGIEQQTEFSPMARLFYSLEPSESDDTIRATFGNNRISLFVSLARVKHWAATEQMGIEAIQSVGHDRDLRLLIEKDLQCLQPRPEEDQDAFPNPKHASQTC